MAGSSSQVAMMTFLILALSWWWASRTRPDAPYSALSGTLQCDANGLIDGLRAVGNFSAFQSSCQGKYFPSDLHAPRKTEVWRTRRGKHLPRSPTLFE